MFLCDSPCKIWSATLGCLLWNIWRLSAQLDQYASFVVKTALRNPKPPREKRRLTTSQNMWVGGADTSWLRALRRETHQS